MPNIDTPSALLDIEHIKSLKARYFRLVDTHKWKEFGDLFTDDVQARVDADPAGSPGLVCNGRDDFVARVKATLQNISHVHHGHMPEITLIDATKATGIWAMFDRVAFADRIMNGYGHYHEEYRREADGQWRISRLHLTRLRIEFEPNGAKAR